ncbi:hypothetical protein yc1106_09146 [Curvularia clavata]|uniref:Uncharacterized protein n=1 Tax=Curvularia clavata TaxID=95742 RepID=A0A9Q8ZH58_CURCL|nr:hypothetical protein yc1106_09146 [Curvularia clavata]
MTSDISMNKAFSRLRWSIFEDISSIQVMDDPQSPNPNLSPFWGHAIATEPATNVPLTEIEFTSDDLDNYIECDYDYTAPDALLVKRADGGIVTISDVVEQLGPYFLSHKEAILLAKAVIADPGTTTVPYDGPKDDRRTLPANTRVFFDGTFLDITDPRKPWFPITFWVEGEDGDSIEDHWR